MLIAANFHYIRESFAAPYPSIFGVTPPEFERQLDALGGSGADFLAARDILDILIGLRAMPARAVVVTFDDGFREQYEIAWPILRRKGIPAIFFVNTRSIGEDFVTTTHKIHLLRAHVPPVDLLAVMRGMLDASGIPFELPTPEAAREVYKYDTPADARFKYFLNHVLDERQRSTVVDGCFAQLGFDEKAVSRDLYMTPAMTADLARDGALGTHGHAHVPMGLLDEPSARSDVERSLTLLREWTGTDVPALSYPFGFREACSRCAADEAGKKGVRFAFTMERAGNRAIDAPFFMGRFASNDVPGGRACGDPEGFWGSLHHAAWFRERQ